MNSRDFDETVKRIQERGYDDDVRALIEHAKKCHGTLVGIAYGNRLSLAGRWNETKDGWIERLRSFARAAIS